MTTSFGVDSFLLRWLFALLLVLGTYNPTSYSFVGWLAADDFSMSPVFAIVGIALVIGWVIYLKATFDALGPLGIILGLALFSAIVWLLIDIGLLSLESPGALTWIALVLMSLLLGTGMSWSHISRKMTGQIDVDDVED